MRAGDKWFVTLQEEKNGNISDFAEDVISVHALKKIREKILDTKDIDIYDLLEDE